ncbi:MAG: hypothetical protein HQM14_04625 [SAR324 cluster bacterium]|nr:hypothetical protein [SAR324 cluster bacterium]
MTADQSQKKIRELKQQIKLHKEQNQMLLQYVDDMKVARNQMQHQLEMSQEREKLSFLREKRDFQRILELEKKLELIAPPESQNITGYTTHDAEEAESTATGQRDSTEEDFTDDVDEEIDYTNKEMQRLVDRALRKMVQEQKPVPSPSSTTDPLDRKESPGQHDIEEREPPTAENEASVDESENQEKEAESSDPLQETIVTANTSIEAETPVNPETHNQVTEESPKAEDETSADKQNYLINEYFNRGLSAASQKDFFAAIEAFTKVTTLLPNAAPSYLNLAILHFRLENYEEALHFCQAAIQRGSQPAQQLQTKIQKEIDKD